MPKVKKRVLTADTLREEARRICEEQSVLNHEALIGVTDGKAVGTYIEHLFQESLGKKYIFLQGNSAKGIDFPEEELNTDLKVTSVRQPQSSCPFKSARQKIFGLGYNLLVMVYDKRDTRDRCELSFCHCVFVSQERTADYTMSRRLIEMKADGANLEDIVAFLGDRNLPGDEVVLRELAEEILERDLTQGYLTVSNALQWRLQYGRLLSLKNRVLGVINHDWDR